MWPNLFRYYGAPLEIVLIDEDASSDNTLNF
jgi:hypothetical protein